MAAYVYIMSNKRYGTMYVGVTSDILRRTWQHREGMLPGFTSKYGLHDLVGLARCGNTPPGGDTRSRELSVPSWPDLIRPPSGVRSLLHM